MRCLRASVWRLAPQALNTMDKQKGHYIVNDRSQVYREDSSLEGDAHLGEDGTTKSARLHQRVGNGRMHRVRRRLGHTWRRVLVGQGSQLRRGHFVRLEGRIETINHDNNLVLIEGFVRIDTIDAEGDFYIDVLVPVGVSDLYICGRGSGVGRSELFRRRGQLPRV